MANCFEPASVYIVITEKDRKQDDTNTFKLILHFCARHDYDFKYLFNNNELEVAKRRHLVLKQ